MSVILTIAFNHTVAVIAHVTKQLDNRDGKTFGIFVHLVFLANVQVYSKTSFVYILENVMICIKRKTYYLVVVSLTVSQTFPFIMAMPKEGLLTLGAHKMLSTHNAFITK